ncbi:MAG: tryptophan synthase subunit alpha [Sulfobacillus acidophilus]|uniref:Tryptophan synthase alpha chain n=1 Tax=Sulfobacillus acidophilus TaxID=53633 RepID=A0A2T2WDT2_9FIRM|nr:MAG: tryptophan synthase subunit alpha [Sulfobacillus acidophilus]
MRRIEEAFQEAKQQNRAALITYITAGYPNLEILPNLVRALSEAGSDIIEIGIPFSDPLADGPVLQRAATVALNRGARVSKILAAVEGFAADAAPLVFLTYINPVFHYGVGRFAQDAVQAGIQGLIIPDLPWVEGRELRTAAEASRIAVIPLVAPTSTDAHLRAIGRARGFVYAVSLTGVTGVRKVVDAGVRPLVERIRHFTRLPIAVGFGIATPEQAHEVGEVADGVIVGSALVDVLTHNPGREEEAAFRFVHDLSQAVKNITTKA